MKSNGQCIKRAHSRTRINPAVGDFASRASFSKHQLDNFFRLFLLSEVFVYVNLQHLYLTSCEARLIDGRKHHSREHRMAENGYYRDFRAHLQALEQHGKLIRITREINKDTELMPLVRWQFRGLEEAERKAFIFEKVIDSRNRRYAMPVTVGTLAATTEIYAIGMMCDPGKFMSAGRARNCIRSNQ